MAIGLASSLPVSPPVDGSTPVVPGLIDFNDIHNPHLPWALLASPETTAPAGSVSWREYAEATHRVAHTLRPNRAGPDNQVIALLINCDTMYYLALIPGLIRAGLVPFPMSPRNSAPAIVNLLKRTSCHRMICQPSLSSLLFAVQEELDSECWSLTVENLPDIETIFPALYGKELDEEFAPYPTRENVDKFDIAFYLHSSGSTGFPKPVPQRFVNMLEVSNCSILRDSRSRGIVWGPMALPPFHVMGIYTALYGPLASGLPIGLFAPRAPASPLVPTPQITLRACLAIGCSGIPTVPAFIDAWAKDAEDVKLLKELRVIAFAGGPLASKTGASLIAAGVPLYPWYGATEFGSPTLVFTLVTDPHAGPSAKALEDWEWLEFGDYVNTRWEPQGDGTYELQYLTCETHHPCIENLSDCRGYATNDLFQPHPTKPGLWRVTGRKDDVLVLGSGEKVVPIPQEGVIGRSRMVDGAVMFGRGKSQCGVLIELSLDYVAKYSSPEALPKFRNAIWPIIEEANHIAPAFGKIFKEMIMIVDPARPLPRAAKSTVMRKQALQVYAKDIEELYTRVENSATSADIAPPKTWSPEDVEAWLIAHASSIVSGKAVTPTVDVFDQGFDSLHATFLRNRIIGALRSDPDLATQTAQSVSQNFVFEHPTLHELALVIVALVESGSPGVVRTAEQQIIDMIEKYAAGLPSPAYTPAHTNGVAGDIVVLLTGSTGNVGSQLLASMLANSKFDKIYTLNRGSAHNQDRQKVAFEERGLDASLLDDPRLTQLVGEVTKENFGLALDAFAEVRDTVTHVLHNAWRVDFNLSLQSFEAHISGTRKLIDFCCAVERPIKLFFTSSISETRNWDASIGPVPEEPIPSPEVATANGYGSSKYVAEQILARAAKNGLQCTSLRLGQVCGPVMTGAWSTTEWFPIMVKSSMSLEVLPELDGLVSWIPADAVADAMIDLVMSKEPLPPVLNLVHPRPVPWNVVRRGLSKYLAQRPLPTIPLREWLDKVEQVPVNNETVDEVPAIKLIEYYRGLVEGECRFAEVAKTLPVETGGWPVFSTKRIQQYSPTLRDLDVLGATHAEAWVRYWKQAGFLH